MKVEVVQAHGSAVSRKTIDLPAGARIADALAGAGFVVPADGAVGVSGRLRAADEAIFEGDRIEIYEPLLADPRQARRNRTRLRRMS